MTKKIVLVLLGVFSLILCAGGGLSIIVRGGIDHMYTPFAFYFIGKGLYCFGDLYSKICK